MKLTSAVFIAALLVSPVLSAQWGDVPQGQTVWTSHDTKVPMDSIVTMRTDTTFNITADVEGKVHSDSWKKNRRGHWKHVGKKTKSGFYEDCINHRLLISPCERPSMTYVYYVKSNRP